MKTIKWTQGLAVLIIASIPGQIVFGEGKDRKALFGELHIHTKWTFDAYLFNTRGSIYDAMRRKETWGTSGPRIRVRFFGGFNMDAVAPGEDGWVDEAYKAGVSMGGELGSSDVAPTFAVWAVKDVDGANLDRIQVVKAWSAGGKSQEHVYDVVWSGNRKPDPESGKVPAVGSTRWRMVRARVDFPQPLSPTSPRISPSLRVKETPSTALSEPTDCSKIIPFLTGKCFSRSRTSRIESLMGLPLNFSRVNAKTGASVAGLDFIECGGGCFAGVYGVLAAWSEGAAIKNRSKIRRHLRNRVQPFTFFVGRGQTRHEGAGVGVAMMREKGFGGGGFANFTGVHHHDSVAGACNDAEVVRN